MRWLWPGGELREMGGRRLRLPLCRLPADSVACVRPQLCSTKGAGKTRKLPITPELLGRMLDCLSQDGGWLAARDAFFYVASWFGMLRGAEALALTWADVTVLPEGLQLFIPFSKTDQRGEGAFVLLGALPGCPLDPVHFAQAWRAQSGGAPAALLVPMWGGDRAVAKDTRCCSACGASCSASACRGRTPCSTACTPSAAAAPRRRRARARPFV